MNRTRTVSRRLFTYVAVGSMLFAGLLVSLAPAAAQEAEPQSGGRLVFATNVEPSCFDPQISAQDATNMLARSVVDSLVEQLPDGTFEPWLAESFDVSEDVTQFTFHLRSGITFSDGTPFNAEAVKFNLDRIADPATQSQYAISLLGPYESTTVIDNLTAQVNFTEGFSPFLQALSQPNLGIQSPTALQANAPCDPPVGSGPFIFKEVNPQESVILERNPNYTSAPPTATHAGPAYLDELEYRWVPDDAVRVGSLTSGQVDVSDVIPPKDVEDLVGQGYTQLSAVSPGLPYVIFVNSSNAPWDDIRVREAFRASLDIDGIVDALYFGQKPRAWSPLSPTTLGYDPSLEGSWQQDIDRANTLLDEAGWTWDGDFRVKDGQTLVARWPIPGGADRDQRTEIQQLIKEQARAVGIDVQIESVGIGPYLEAIQNNQYDLGDFSFVRSDPDTLRIMFESTNVPTPERIAQNFAHVNSPEVDAWANQAAQTLDPAARTELYTKIQQWITQNVAVIPIYCEAEILFTKSNVHGVVLSPQAYPTFYDAWIEQ
jgi:peptide/nickel transport system substrate-binding protein